MTKKVGLMGDPREVDGVSLGTSAGHGEDNRRGIRQITSHTLADPVGVGGFRFVFKVRDYLFH